MIERALENPQIAAAIVGLIVSALGGLGWLLVWVLRSHIPKRVDARFKERMQELELQQSEIDARAMRDRAIADAINHAAGTNAQAMEVIKLMTQILQHSGREEGYVKDELSRINLMLHRNGKQLELLNQQLEQAENADSENESDDSSTHDSGHSVGSDSTADPRPA